MPDAQRFARRREPVDPNKVIDQRVIGASPRENLGRGVVIFKDNDRGPWGDTSEEP